MDTNQAGWPGEPPANLLTTSTHDVLFLHGQPSLAGPAYKDKGKRSRNALSCAECRRLKLKCSREPWPCQSCVKRKCAQVCPDEVLKEVRPSRAKEVNALQDRIRELEHQLAAATGQQPLSPVATASGHLPSAVSANSREVAEANHPGIADVAEVMGTLLLGEDGSSRYLGKSAANAWFHDAGSDEDEGSVGSGDDDDDALSSSLYGTAFPMVSRGLDVQDFQAMLPPISEARALSDAYYTNCAYMYEPLQRAVFNKHLTAAYTSDDEDQSITLEQLACIFMILALGILFDLEGETSDSRSAKYHSIAQASLTSAKFLNIPSLASIQCLHLMATWQLTTHSQTGAFRAWPLLGLAGRMVLSTGLHRDGSIWAIQEPDLSIRRSLFWELVCYDRLQGMILGRPYMINSKHFDTIMPRPLPGQSYSGESLEFHHYKYELCMIIGELCDDCFSIGRPQYETILRHDRRLRAFKQSLPEWLQFDPMKAASGKPPPADSREMRQILQCHTITVKVHETMLFLHRVAFAQAIEHYPAEPLRSPWAQSVVSLTLEASRTLIAITRSAYHHYPRLAARWWHIQVHCFGAGVCFAAVCIKSPASALTRLSWSELSDACSLLESTSTHGVHARELYPRLRKLRDQAQSKLESFQASGSNRTSYEAAGRTSRAAYAASTIDPDRMEGTETPPGAATGSRESSAAADDGKLVVLGATTRKLDGRHFPGRPPPKNSAGPRRGDKDTSSASSGGSGSTYLPPRQSDIPVSWPPQPSSAPYTATEFSAVQSPPATALPTTGYFSSITIPANNVQLQSYENLDPALAEVLAQISGTQARENSAIFPILEKNYGSLNSALAGFGPPTSSLAQSAGATSTVSTPGAQLQNNAQSQSSGMQFDLTGTQKPHHAPTYGYNSYTGPQNTNRANEEDISYESGEDMTSSPGRQYFDGHPEEASIQPVLQDALSPPPPGPTGLPLPVPPASQQQQRQFQQLQYQDARSRQPMGPPPSRYPSAYVPSVAHQTQYPQQHPPHQYASQQHNAPRYAGGPTGDAFQEHNWMGYYPSVMSGSVGSSANSSSSYNNSGPYGPPTSSAAYSGPGSARAYPTSDSSAPNHPYYTTPSVSAAQIPQQQHASSSGVAPLSAPAASSAGYSNAGSTSLPNNVYEPSGYRVYDDLLTSLSGFPNDPGQGRR